MTNQAKETARIQAALSKIIAKRAAVANKLASCGIGFLFGAGRLRQLRALRIREEELHAQLLTLG